MNARFSTDPLFFDKVCDVVGLCLNSPDKALVLRVDEKSQIQALDRAQQNMKRARTNAPPAEPFFATA